MLKTHTEERIIDDTVIDDVLCNRCGNSCKTQCGNYEGIIEHTIRGGYDSKLGDQVDYTFSICETCLEELFDKFAINPLRGEEDDK